VAIGPGTRVGPYEVIVLIGQGGMGEVYRATDTNLKRTVAIKVLPQAVATDPERLSRFQREAEVLARLIIRTSRRFTAWSGALTRRLS
jgi:serine/threonine protein kinase